MARGRGWGRGETTRFESGWGGGVVVWLVGLLVPLFFVLFLVSPDCFT